MFAFLQPLLLAAGVALLVPVAIHLWSRGAGRRVQVGSIRLLEAAAPPRARRLRLTQPGLLAVRLLLLAALVALVADPVLRRPPADESPRRWVLAAPEADTREPSTAALLERLGRDGAEVRRLAPGFPLVDADAPPDNNVVDAWSLLREADALLPPGSTIDVVAPPRLAYAAGVRPALAVAVAWHAAGGTAGRWIDDARALGDGAVSVRLTTSDDTLARTARVVLAANAPPPAVPLSITDGTVRLPDGGARRITPPDSLRITVVRDDAHAEDARYVRAAVRAAADGRPVRLDERSPEGPRTDADLTFWLADAPPPDRLAGRVVVAGAAASPSVLPVPDGPWTRLDYGGRFHPAHAPVVLEAEFPRWVQSLVRSLDAPSPEHRRASLGQLVPSHAAAASPARPPADAATPLRLPVWLAAAALFALERWMAARP